MNPILTFLACAAAVLLCSFDGCDAEAAEPVRAREALAILCPSRVNLAPAFERAARRYHVPAALLTALVRVESTCNPLAVGPKGTLGLGQIKPGTRAALGYTNAQLLTPGPNAIATARHLRWALDLCDGVELHALYVYNARKRCRDYGPDKRGVDFARRVLGFWNEVEGARKS